MKVLKYKKFVGLHIVCKRCNRQIELSQTQYKGCNHPLERQRYKAVIKINGVRRTKDLKSLVYDDAVKELLEFKELLINPIELNTNLKPNEEKFELFTDFMFMYSDWLENIGVPRHEQKIRSEKYIKETVGYINKFGSFLKKNGGDLSKLTIYQIDKFMLGKYYEYLEETYKSHATFNHNLRALKNFYNFLTIEKELVIPNVPKKMKLKYENPNPTSISDQDFLKLLSVITEKDSIEILKSGAKKNRYRPYTKDGIELCAYTGMRLEEVTSLKYSDIVIDTDGELECIIGTDLKFERAHNWDKTKATKSVYIPISNELKELLERLDYKSNLGVNKYLIADDMNIDRKTLAKQLSHSFTFYRRQAKLGDDFSIKHLRKTFLTKLHLQTGLTESMGYQKTASVVLKNYIDKKAVVKEANKRGFRYFNTNANG
ncbi:MAG: tyrosine-type recombinase/integrase [Flavobacterium sp.]|uniref:tyrosine-type recombinase/integrase n=1 Tax=Flavobacterium sp. TaxID=239 RepID=UPI003BC0DFDB